MTPNINEMLSTQKGKRFQGQGPNWILIAGGALLSTLSVRLGYRLKQAFDSKQPKNSTNGLKENGKRTARKRPGNCRLHSSLYSFEQDDGCYNCASGNEGDTETKPQYSGRLHTEPEPSLSLTTVSVSAPVYTKQSSQIWSTSPDRLDPPQRLDSPCISESSSDIFTKREVIQKLRQQLKKRDDMILEMQDQVAELQSSLASQRTRADHLQSVLEAANRDVFDSEREIRRLRKAVGNANGGNEVDKVEMLRKEIGELKDLIKGKDYLVHNYKEQKSELSVKVKELQQHRLDSQVANIF